MKLNAFSMAYNAHAVLLPTTGASNMIRFRLETTVDLTDACVGRGKVVSFATSVALGWPLRRTRSTVCRAR